MNEWMKKFLGLNWKTNLAAVAAFLVSVPQFVVAIEHWAHHEPADWRGAVLSVVVAAGMAVAKDSTTHSTQAEVAVSTVENPKVQNEAVVKAVVDASNPPQVKGA